MKAFILAGGAGTRMGEETTYIPKPLVRLGKFPILLHVMDVYGRQGVTEFVVLAGHLGEKIIEYFANFHLLAERIDIDLGSGMLEVGLRTRDYKVTILETGATTMTGGRLLRAIRVMDLQEPFYWTYGDGLGNISLQDLREVHSKGNFEMTISGVRPDSRFGLLEVEGQAVKKFLEKPIQEDQWINAGFGIAEPTIQNYLKGDGTVLEGEAMQRLAGEGKLGVNLHSGFWKPMDTPKDKIYLENCLAEGPPPWLDTLENSAPDSPLYLAENS